MRRIIDIVRSKYERMNDSERKQLLSHYPDEMLMEDDSVFFVYDGDVRVSISGKGKLIDVEYCLSDRY